MPRSAGCHNNAAIGHNNAAIGRGGCNACLQPHIAFARGARLPDGQRGCRAVPFVMQVCGRGGTGRRAALRSLWELNPVEVRVFSAAPHSPYLQTKSSYRVSCWQERRSSAPSVPSPSLDCGQRPAAFIGFRRKKGRPSQAPGILTAISFTLQVMSSTFRCSIQSIGKVFLVSVLAFNDDGCRPSTID